MPKYLPNDAIADVAPLPSAFDFAELRSDLFAPRISFAVKSLATDPSSILFVHYENLALALGTSKDSRAVRNAFEFLIVNNYVEKISVPLILTSSMNIVRLTMEGQALAHSLGYEVAANNWSNIISSRKDPDKEYIGQVLQIAYQCKIREIPAKITPWIASDNPPDLQIGDEERWVYASGSQTLNRKTLSRLASSAKEAGNYPMGIISKRERNRDKMSESCKDLGISAKFSDLEALIKDTKNSEKNEVEKGPLWLLEK
jgi:hypothetical protein